MADMERKSFTISLDKSLKEDIEDNFLKHKIKNYQEGYREIIDLGYEQWKKIKKGEKK
jgi:hypothetical protein